MDVKVLFGEELTGGHEIDWLMPSDEARARVDVLPYGNGQAWVSASARGHSPFAKLWLLVQELANNVRLFKILRSGDSQFVLVKDRFLAGTLALHAAKLNGVRFVFSLAYPSRT